MCAWGVPRMGSFGGDNEDSDEVDVAGNLDVDVEAEVGLVRSRAQTS